MVIIEQHVDGVPKTLARLDHLDKGLQDRTSFHKQAGLAVIEDSQKQFVAGGDPRWQPLSPVTVALRRKGKKLNAPKPLRDTDLLMASIGNPGKGGVYEIDQTSVLIGTKRKGAALLHEGGRTKGFIKGAEVPPRPFLILTIRGKKKILRLAEEFVRSREKEAMK